MVIVTHLHGQTFLSEAPGCVKAYPKVKSELQPHKLLQVSVVLLHYVVA